MILTRTELAEIQRQAEAEYPAECCGVIFTKDGPTPLRRLFPCRNIQDEKRAEDPISFPRESRTAYYMHPQDTFHVHRAQDEGERVSVIYHSHIDAGAYFSETDKRNALPGGVPAFPETIYVVVSVEEGKAREAVAYRWDPAAKDFLPVPLSVGEEVTASERLFAQATGLIPGGANSPVRAFRAVGGSPFFVARGAGARLWDVDGASYLDYVSSWGPLILGHAHPKVVAAVREAAEAGTSYGAPTPGEVDLARVLIEAVPSLDLVRLVNSGTEAVMSALRLARGVTGRQKILKFDGGYHGHADSLLVRAGSGGLTFSLPDSLGVPLTLAQLTMTVPYNDVEAVRSLMAREGADVAAIIVEPVAGNMGVVPPAPGFLEGLREIATAHGALLIFDEVITGFRLGWGGAQAKYRVIPDLTCLGKIIGGGLPVGAYGGRKEMMAQVAPLGGVYQAGTLSGNPLAVAAGLATLELLREPGAYDRLEHLGQTLEVGLVAAARRARVSLRVNRVGSMLTAFFTGNEVRDLASAKTADVKRYGLFFHGMLSRGVFFAPSQFEAAFCSLAHTEADLESTVEAAQEVFSSLR